MLQKHRVLKDKKTDSMSGPITETQPRAYEKTQNKYKVLVSRWFLLNVFVSCILLSFAVGRNARSIFQFFPRLSATNGETGKNHDLAFVKLLEVLILPLQLHYRFRFQ